MSDTALVVQHNGPRPFSLADVESITGIGNSTKKDDATQIGKFGIGFKAVFAYTTRPEIRSADNSFAIVDLFVPEPLDNAGEAGLTSFAFPFDRAEKPADVAVVEVERGLRELDEKTLLFLNGIKSITYTLPSGEVGLIERQPVDDLIVNIIASHADELVESKWMRLVGPATVYHSGPSPLTVAAAFQLEEIEAPTPKGTRRNVGSPEQSVRPIHRIVPVAEGDVSIYFPAAKETSGLRFHIHAPFASTVARDSVRDDPENHQLVDDIGSLIVSHLPTLRDNGMLDESLLAALPNSEDALAHPYRLIRDALVAAFDVQELTPVRGGGFGPATSLVSSPSEFRNWLDPSDLPTLLDLADIQAGKPPRWIRDLSGRAGRFLNGLATIEFGWRELGAVLGAIREHTSYGYVDGHFVAMKTPTAEKLETWRRLLESKSDDAVLRLYQLIGHGLDEREVKHDLKSIPLIRLRQRDRLDHVKGPDTFLPSSRSDNVQARVPVELAYFDDDDDSKRASRLRSFYSATGTKRWDEKARIEARLRKYAGESREVPEDEDSELSKHLDDVKAFAIFGLNNRASAKTLFADVKFLLSPHPDGSLLWVCPGDTYMDDPFETTGLSALHEWTKDSSDEDDDEEESWNEPTRFSVAGIYLQIESIEEFLRLVGAASNIQIESSSVYQNPQYSYSWWNGKRRSDYTVTRDWDIPDFDQIVVVAEPTLLTTLWRTVATAPLDRASARFQANNSSQSHTLESRICQRLKQTPWIPGPDGQLKRPREVTLETLPQDWAQPSATSLASALDFGYEARLHEMQESAQSAHAKALGIELDDVELVKELQEAGFTDDELRELARERRRKLDFPEIASDDPERRSALAEIDAAGAPEHQTEIRLRSVSVGQSEATEESKTYLRQQYTTDQEEMFCQGCHEILPFKVKGTWYFEAVQFARGRAKVHPANHIALCPLCAALYKHTLQTKTSDLVDSLLELPVAKRQGSVRLPVLINDRRVELRFTGKHAIDLQAALRAAGEER